MAVKARFRCTGYTAGQMSREKKGEDGHSLSPREFETVEVRSPTFNAVYVDPHSPGGKDNPNRAFWEATPSGEIKLHTINPAAWSQFEMGKVYDVIFEEVPPEAQ